MIGTLGEFSKKIAALRIAQTERAVKICEKERAAEACGIIRGSTASCANPNSLV